MRPGRGAILQAGDAIYLAGSGASPLGDRPFLDRLDLKSLATERVFQTDDRSYETVAALLSDDGKRLLTRWETKTDFPNYYMRDLAAGTKTAVTQFKDPAPQLTGIQKQLVTYDRKDGVKTLPEAALRFCLSDPRVSTAIVGMRKTAHVDANCAVSDGRGLPEDDTRSRTPR